MQATASAAIKLVVIPRKRGRQNRKEKGGLAEAGPPK
jgi:hypothetical protein